MKWSNLALKHLPHAVCIVPEKREERTTEGGLDVIKHHDQLIPVINQLKDAGVRCSLFIEPETKQVDAANSVGASVVEIHTGSFCETDPTSETKKYNAELERIKTQQPTELVLDWKYMQDMVWITKQ